MNFRNFGICTLCIFLSFCLSACSSNAQQKEGEAKDGAGGDAKGGAGGEGKGGDAKGGEAKGGAGKGAGGPQMPPPLVKVVKVTAANAPIFSEFPAQTYARDLVEVRGKVDGYIDKWLFRPGQMVTAGQALYILDTRPFRAAVEEAQGALTQAKADLEYAKQQTMVRQAEATLVTQKANLLRSQQDYDRLKPLVEQDAAAKQDLDAATAQLRSNEAAVRSAEANLEQVKVQTSTQISAGEGRVAAQQGTLTTANLNLEYGTIRAPIGGKIGDTLIPVGGLVSANSGSALTTIVPLQTIWIRFRLSESQYLSFKQRAKGSVLDNIPLQLFLADDQLFPQAGRITNTSNQVDSRTGTLELQASFPNPSRNLLPGQFGRVRLQTDERRNVILVPQRAVQIMQSVQTIYALTPDNKIQARAVKTGERVGDQWIIEQGLKPGERIIVEGTFMARPGMQVRPEPYEPGKKESAKGGQSKGA